MKVLIHKIIKKVNKIFNNIMWGIFDFGLIKIKTNDGHAAYVFRVFGLNLFKIGKTKVKRTLSNDRIIYFKINRTATYSLKCIQGWINVANELKYPFVIS